MANAKKLPSGSWRVQVYDYTDEKGKKHYKSFTDKNKKTALMEASKYAANKEDYQSIESITVREAVKRYIKLKEEVLSPSTVKSYYGILNVRFGMIGNKKIDKLTNSDVQLWISEISDNVSPKTVANAYALFKSAYSMFYRNANFDITLPQRKRSELYVPSDSDIKRLLEYVSGKELELAILLAAFGPLRRGEICALESTDISGNMITINKSMVRKYGGGWVIKQPKTYESYRTIDFPDFVIEKLKGIEGRIIKATPDQITNRFVRAIEYSGLPKFRFHDLRHYSASIMHAINVPDQYIMKRGGWSSDGVMKRVYRNAIDEQTKKYNEIINNHFSDISHEISHEFQNH